MTESAPATNRLRRYRSPCLLILPSLSLPPLECCFGTSPIQAEKSLPDRNALGSATLATGGGAVHSIRSGNGPDPTTPTLPNALQSGWAPWSWNRAQKRFLAPRPNEATDTLKKKV